MTTRRIRTASRSREINRPGRRSPSLTNTGRHDDQPHPDHCAHTPPSPAASTALRPWLLLGTRLWVSWQFLKSGWLKLTTWDVTLELFRSEYQVPVLPPTLAAICGTFGELFFPLLLVLGLFTRVGALGLFAVNAWPSSPIGTCSAAKDSKPRSHNTCSGATCSR